MELTDEELKAILDIANKLERCAVCKARKRGKPVWTPLALEAWDKLNNELHKRKDKAT